MRNITIRVENPNKRYHLCQRESYKTLRDTLTGGFTIPFRHLHSRFQCAILQHANNNETYER